MSMQLNNSNTKMIQHQQTSVTHLLNKTIKLQDYLNRCRKNTGQNPTSIHDKKKKKKNQNLDKVDIEGTYINILGLPGCLSGRIYLPMQEAEEPQVRPLGWKILWRRKWQPTPVFLPGKFHGQKSLVGYSPWGCKELDTTEQFNILNIIYDKYSKHSTQQ